MGSSQRGRVTRLVGPRERQASRPDEFAARAGALGDVRRVAAGGEQGAGSGEGHGGTCASQQESAPAQGVRPFLRVVRHSSSLLSSVSARWGTVSRTAYFAASPSRLSVMTPPSARAAPRAQRGAAIPRSRQRTSRASARGYVRVLDRDLDRQAVDHAPRAARATFSAESAARTRPRPARLDHLGLLAPAVVQSLTLGSRIGLIVERSGPKLEPEGPVVSSAQSRYEPQTGRAGAPAGECARRIAT